MCISKRTLNMVYDLKELKKIFFESTAKHFKMQIAISLNLELHPSGLSALECTSS